MSNAASTKNGDARKVTPSPAIAARNRPPEATAAQNAAAAGKPANADAAELANLSLLGPVCWLLSRSPQHQHMFMSDLDWRIRPPIILRQCRLFRREGRPHAFLTWAFVSDEIAGRLQGMPGRLRPEEWRCGNRPVFIDVVAPFGGAEDYIKEVVRLSYGVPKAPAGDAPAVAAGAQATLIAAAESAGTAD